MKKLIIAGILSLGIFLSQTIAQNYIKNFQSVGEIASIGDTLYFAANEGAHGTELWRSDGTTEGTWLVKDIQPGRQGSVPEHIVVLNNEIYFAANDGVYGCELWKSDGTAEGTVMVYNIRPEVAMDDNSSYPRDLRVFKNRIYFTAFDDGDGNDLWESDGTAAGTKEVHNSTADYLSELTVLGDNLYFVKSYNSFQQLWISDGTSTGTVQLPVDDLYTIQDLHAFNGTLYFTTRGSGFIRLYVKLSGASECLLLKDFGAYEDVDNITLAGSSVYFSARSHLLGYIDVLWKTDGTPGGTVEVKTFDWDYYIFQSYIRDFMAFNNELYFRGGNSTNYSVWKSNGTQFGTIPVAYISPYPYNSFLTASGDQLFYCKDGDLWVSDGSEIGTEQFAEINPNGSASPANLTDVKGILYYTADDGSGTALWNSIPNPEIVVYNGWQNIRSGENIWFDSTKVDEVCSRKIVIQNTGKKELILSGISLSGNDFYAENKSCLLGPGERDTLAVRYLPATSGEKSEQLTIFNNDNNENKFVIHLHGKAGSTNATNVLSIDSISLVNCNDAVITDDTFSLSPISIYENILPGSIAGTFEISGESIENYTLMLTAGAGDEDNEKFYINNNDLFTAGNFDFEIQSTYVIRVRAEGNNGSHFEKFFVIRLNDVNENMSPVECGQSFYNLSYALNGVDYVNDSIVLAVGEDGVILRSSDGGIHWQKINSGTRVNLSRIQFISEETGVILGSTILKTENGGKNWFPLQVEYPGTLNLSDVFFINENEGFAIGNQSYVFKTSNGGKTWTFKNLGSDTHCSSVYFINSSTGFLFGNSNSLWRTTDSGLSWKKIDLSAYGWNIWFRDMSFPNAQTGYIADLEGKIYKTVDGGTVWTQISQVGTNYANCIRFISNEIGFIAGGYEKGVLFKTEDGGSSWTDIPVDFGSPSDIAFNSSGEKGIVVGDADGFGGISESGSFITESGDAGESWQNISIISGSTDFYSTRLFPDGTGYLFGGVNNEKGIAYKSNDNGITWQRLSLNPPVNISKCYYISKDTVFAVADRVYLTKDGGNTWVNAPQFDGERKYHFVNFDTVYSESNGNVYKSVDAGQAWDLIYESSHFFTHINFLNGKVGFVIGWETDLKTEDGGQTWSVYDHGLHHVLRTMYYFDRDKILIGGNDGLLMKSDDGGANWRMINMPFQMNVTDFKFFDELNGIAFISNDIGSNEVWVTSDAGETWTLKLQKGGIISDYFATESGDIYFAGESGAFYEYSDNLPPSQAGYIIGEDTVCSGTTMKYKAPLDNSGVLLWNLTDNQYWISENTAIINWNKTGQYAIEVMPINACGIGISRELFINVVNPPDPQILGRDTVNQNETNVIYQPVEQEGLRNLWHVEGNKYITETDEGKISVDWSNKASGKVDLIQTSLTTGCRQKVSKPVIINKSTGIVSPDKSLDIEVFPNPVSDFLNIHIPDHNGDTYQIRLYNESGGAVYVNTSSRHELTIDTHKIVPGNYLLIIQNNTKASFVKIVKK